MPFPNTQSPPCRCSLPSQLRRGKEDSPFSLSSPLASPDPPLRYFFSFCKAKTQLGSSPELKGPFDPLSQRTEGPPAPAPLRRRSAIAPRRHKMAAAGSPHNGVSCAAVRGGRSSAGWGNPTIPRAGPQSLRRGWAVRPSRHSSDRRAAHCAGQEHSTFPSEQVTNKPLVINTPQQNLQNVQNVKSVFFHEGTSKQKETHGLLVNPSDL